MKIIIDERESFLYSECFSLLQNEKNPYPNIHLSKEVLPLGDILVKTEEDLSILLIERKTIADLLASIKDGRYEEQSHRLIHSEEFPQKRSIMYLIEGMFTFHQDRKTVLSAITSLQLFKGFSVQRTCSIAETAEYILHMADKVERNMKKGKKLDFFEPAPSSDPLPVAVAPYCSVVKKVKKENITAQNMGEIMLCQIPGISANAAVAILKHEEINGSFLKLLDVLKTNPSALEKVIIGGTAEKKGRKISKSIIEKMRELLLV